MPIVPRAKVPRTQQAGLTLPAQNPNTPAGAFGGAEAAATTQLGNDVQGAGVNLANAATRIQDREDGVTISKALIDYRHGLTEDYLAEQLDGDDFATQTSRVGFADKSNVRKQAILENFTGSARGRAVLEQRLDKEQASMQEASVTQGLVSSRQAVNREIGEFLGAQSKTVGENPAFLPDAIEQFNQHFDIFKGQFTPEEEASRRAAGHEVLALRAIDTAMLSGDQQVVSDTLEVVRPFIPEDTFRKLEFRQRAQQIQADQAVAAQRATQAATREDLRNNGVPITPAVELAIQGISLPGTQLSKAEEGMQTIAALESSLGRPATDAEKKAALGVSTNEKDQTAVEKFQDMQAFVSTVFPNETLGINDFKKFTKLATDPNELEATLAFIKKHNGGQEPTAEQVEIVAGIRETFKRPAKTLAQEVAEKEKITFEKTGQKLTDEQVAKTLGTYVNETKNYTLEERVEQLKKVVTAEGGVVTADNILQLAGAYQGKGGVSAFQEKVAFANKQVRIGVWTAEESKKFLGALTGGEGGVFGDSLKGIAFNKLNELSDKVTAGTATVEEYKEFQSAAAIAQSQNPDGTTNALPAFAEGALTESLENVRFGRVAQEPAAEVPPPTTEVSQPQAEGTVAPQAGAQVGQEVSQSPAEVQATAPAPQPTEAAQPTITEEVNQVLTDRDEAIGGALDEAQATRRNQALVNLQQSIERGTQASPNEPVEQPETTFFEATDLLSGPTSAVRGALEANIATSSFVDAKDVVEMRGKFELFKNNIATSLIENTRITQAERKDLLERLDLDASVFEDPDTLKSRIISVDDHLAAMERSAKARTEQRLPKAEKLAALNKLSVIRQNRALLMPPRFKSAEEIDEALASGNLQVGDKILDENGIIGFIQPEEAK